MSLGGGSSAAWSGVPEVRGVSGGNTVVPECVRQGNRCVTHACTMKRIVTRSVKWTRGKFGYANRQQVRSVWKCELKSDNISGNHGTSSKGLQLGAEHSFYLEKVTVGRLANLRQTAASQPCKRLRTD